MTQSDAGSLVEEDGLDEPSQGSNYNNDSLYNPYKNETKPAVVRKATPEKDYGEADKVSSDGVKKREAKQREKKSEDELLPEGSKGGDKEYFWNQQLHQEFKRHFIVVGKTWKVVS